MMSPKWRWPAMALIACLLSEPALADPPNEDMGAPPYRPCLETARQIDEALARLDELLQKYADKHPDVVAARERIKGREAILRKCLDGDVTANRMLVEIHGAIEYLVAVVDPDTTKHPSGAVD